MRKFITTFIVTLTVALVAAAGANASNSWRLCERDSTYHARSYANGSHVRCDLVRDVYSYATYRITARRALRFDGSWEAANYRVTVGGRRSRGVGCSAAEGVWYCYTRRGHRLFAKFSFGTAAQRRALHSNDAQGLPLQDNPDDMFQNTNDTGAAILTCPGTSTLQVDPMTVASYCLGSDGPVPPLTATCRDSTYTPVQNSENDWVCTVT